MSIVVKGKVRIGAKLFDHYICLDGWRRAIITNLGPAVLFTDADAESEESALAVWRSLQLRLEVAYAIYEPSLEDEQRPAKKGRLN